MGTLKDSTLKNKYTISDISGNLSGGMSVCLSLSLKCVYETIEESCLGKLVVFKDRAERHTSNPTDHV